MNAAFGLRADFLPVFFAAFLAGIVSFSSWKGPPLLRKTARTLTEERRRSKALFPSEEPPSPSGHLPKRAGVKPLSGGRAAGRRRLRAAKGRSPRLARPLYSTRAAACPRRAPPPRRRERAARAPRAARVQTPPLRPTARTRRAPARRSRAPVPRRDEAPRRCAAAGRRAKGLARCAAGTRCRADRALERRRRPLATASGRRAGPRRTRTGSRKPSPTRRA